MKIFTDEFIKWLKENYPAEKWLEFSCQVIIGSEEVKEPSIMTSDSYARELKTVQNHYSQLTDDNTGDFSEQI